MLVLTRRVGECITIGDQIKVRVMAVKGKQVRIGVDAPVTQQVHRQEVYERIVAENQAAMGVGPQELAWASQALKDTAKA